MKMNFYGNIDGNLGYNVHAQGFIEGLTENKVDVKTVPYDHGTMEGLSHKIISSIKKEYYYDAPSVCLSYGNDMLSFTGKKRVGYTVWETTHAPLTWAKQLNTLDDVWTVSKHSRDALAAAGVEKDIKIVPEGVDTTTFTKFVKPLQKDDHFLFLSIFKWEARKSPDILLEAFAEEFKPGEKVALLMQSYNPFLQGLNMYAKLFEMNLPPHAPVRIIPPVKTRSEVAAYYRTADCFVLPTKGEAWGLPVMESLACGTPAITTNWGGALEFMNNDIGWLIDVEKFETPDDGMFFRKENFSPENKWAVPSKKHLRELMRYAFEHKDECKKKGELGYEKMDTEFNWKKSTEKVPEYLRALE